MIEKQRFEGLIGAFNAELQGKGYRNKFKVVINNPDNTEYDGSLYECLGKVKQVCQAGEGLEEGFRLYTYAYYRSDKDYIHCCFQVNVREASGFQIAHATWYDGASDRTIGERIQNNTELPACHLLKWKFPKQSLWQRLRGRKLIW